MIQSENDLKKKKIISFANFIANTKRKKEEVRKKGRKKNKQSQ
jgi:hypothetical protein